MTWLKRLPGFRRAPAGLEWMVLKRLPAFALVGTALLVLAMLAAPMLPGADEAKFAATLQIMAVSLLILHWTVVLTVGLLCVIVWIAKGPAFVADAYELSDAERPRAALVAGDLRHPPRHQ